MFFAYLSSPIGSLLLAADKAGLREITFPKNGAPASPQPDWTKIPPPSPNPSANSAPTSPENSKTSISHSRPKARPSSKQSGANSSHIPYGETISYGQLAKRIGNPNASRAVGLANGSNPIPIIIPCHRVIGSNGKLTGYGGGLPIKEKLLALERRQLRLLYSEHRTIFMPEERLATDLAPCANLQFRRSGRNDPRTPFPPSAF